MRITPLDIQQKTFPTQMLRGFEQEEVYSFLELVREEMEELLRENASLKEQLSRADSQLQEFNNMNATLRDTLITTQQMVDEYKADAETRLYPPPTRVGMIRLVAAMMRWVGRQDESVGARISCAASIGSLLVLALIGIRFLPRLSLIHI